MNYNMNYNMNLICANVLAGQTIQLVMVWPTKLNKKEQNGYV